MAVPVLAPGEALRCAVGGVGLVSQQRDRGVEAERLGERVPGEVEHDAGGRQRRREPDARARARPCARGSSTRAAASTPSAATGTARRSRATRARTRGTWRCATPPCSAGPSVSSTRQATRITVGSSARREQRADRWRCLAVRVGKPVVHRRPADLRRQTADDQQEREQRAICRKASERGGRSAPVERRRARRRAARGRRTGRGSRRARSSARRSSARGTSSPPRAPCAARCRRPAAPRRRSSPRPAARRRRGCRAAAARAARPRTDGSRGSTRRGHDARERSRARRRRDSAGETSALSNPITATTARNTPVAPSSTYHEPWVGRRAAGKRDDRKRRAQPWRSRPRPAMLTRSAARGVRASCTSRPHRTGERRDGDRERVNHAGHPAARCRRCRAPRGSSR